MKDQRKTIVFDDKDGHVSMTGVLTGNVIDEVNVPPNIDRRKTIVYDDNNGDVSVTGVVPTNIINEAKKQNADFRSRTVVFGNNDNDLSMTGVATASILDGAKVTQKPSAERRRTIVYNDDDGNVSMTGVLPANIIDETNVQQTTERRKTIVYDNDDGNLSMTGAVPANVIDEVQQMDRRKTVVFGNDDGNLSMTGVAPINIVDGAKEPNEGRRKTIVYENGDDVSVTGVVLVNILDAVTKEPEADRRKTIVYNDNDGNISVTGVVPAYIIDVAKETEPKGERRKTIVYDNEDGDISVTGVVPVNIVEARQMHADRRDTVDDVKVLLVNPERRKTIVYDREDGELSMTGVTPINILDGVNKQTTDNKETEVYANDDRNVPLTVAASELFEDANEHLDEQAAEPCTERRKTVVFGDDDNNVSITGRVPANIIQEANIGQSVNDECRKTIVFENEDGDVSKTGIIPTNIIGEENVIPPSESNQKSVVYDNEGSTVAAAGLLDKEDGDVEIIQPSNTDSRNTVVFEDDDDGNMSVTEVISNNVEEEQSIQASFESRTTVDFEVNDVFMTDSVPNIVPESTNIEVPETPTSFIEGAQTHNNKIDVFDDEEDDKIEMIDAVTIPKLIESFEEEDISMTQDEPQSLKNLGSTTFNKSANQDRTAANKSLADQLLSGIDNPADQTFDKPGVPFSATIDKSQAEQVFATLEKSVAHREQTFNKSVVAPLSTTFNKSSTDVTNIEEKHSATLNKSLANQDITNKSSSGQDQTFNRSLAAHSISMNKILTSNVLVYGATTELEAKTDESNEIAQIVGDVKVEHNDSQVSPKGSLALSKSSAEQLARSRLEAAAVTPPKESILDVLLDMSQASGEELYSKPQSTTLTRPVSTVTELVSTGTELLSTATDIVSIVTDTDSAVTTESFIMVKDGEPETIDNQTLAIEYKKQKHGIVCKLQRRLSELKDTLHIKPKSPKKEKIKTEIQDPCNTPNLDSSKMNSDSDKKLPKPALKSPSSIHTQEKNKSVKIDLASEISDDKEEVECQVDDQMQVDMSLTEEKDEANETKGQANDTKAILDALSDFTDTRRSGDFGPPNPDKIRQSIAPDRKSIVMSREDLLREISMAQVLMKTETAQTELDLDDTQGSSDEQESPPRLSGEVVKTLRFEDDESILESKLLQKPVSCDSPPYRTSSVIPAYEISDPVKELMKDLIKPLADVDQPLFLDPCRSSQANELDSSQIDLIPAKPLLVSPRSCLRKNEQEVAHSVARSEMHVDAEMESKVNKKAEPGPVIVFDHLNPLNNVVLPPLDRAVVHKYNPVGSEHSLTPSIPSLESACCQTEAEAVAVAGAGAGAAVVGLALARATVDRGVAVGLKLGSCLIDRAVATTTVNTLKDCEVNTSIVMKGNREILAQDSSLTLVDDVLPRSPVRVIFKLEEPYSSVMLDSDLSSVQDAPDTGRKRGHAPARGAEVTPKPAIKVQKVSNNMQVSRRPRSQSPAGKDKEIAPPSRGSSVTVAQLYACARSVTSASATDSRCSKDWRPELLHEASSKNLVAEQESGVNVVAKIDVLPFMGTSECEWESRAADVWTFRLLRARLRLMIRLEHRATNTTRVLVRADTPVRLVTVQHVQQGTCG
ncbi:uncharacterized protein LOC125239788 [Leguminivora glycinivorella]|uniref:uncharacterized protein LOC125239788 n=1 Tax=Leguminivora glycinivorella TaxID=1035111 RepID=UPI00200CA628|nr:uncharacterized protein LOC125239788 [Leguminivora glycinivorella]